MQLTTDGVVIRERNIDEDTRLITILTKEYGVISAYANGAKRLRSKLASSTELFCYSHFILFSSKGRYSVDSAETNATFFALRSDIEKLALASYFSELCLELAPEGEEAGEYLRLMLNVLHFLEQDKRSQVFLKAVFELRLLTMAGYMPNLVGCSKCMAFEDEQMYFSPMSGGLLCFDCCNGAVPAGFISVPKGVLTAMRHVIYADFSKLFNFALPRVALAQFSEICEKYLLAQLDKRFKTLDFYHSLFSFRDQVGVENVSD